MTNRIQQNHHSPLIRLAHPLAFSQFSQHHSLPVHKQYARSGLPMYCNDAAAWVPVKNAWMLFDQLSDAVGPGIGWLVGRYAQDNALNDALLAKVGGSATLLLGLKCLIRLVAIESSHLSLDLLRTPTGALLTTSHDMKSWSGYEHSQAYQLSVYCEIIRHYTGPDWQPLSLGIEGREFPAEVSDLFPGCSLHTQQAQGYIEIDQAALAASPQHRVTLPGTSLPPHVGGFKQAVQSVIESYLQEGPINVSHVAKLLDVSKRTLSRKLQADGTRFQRELDRIRFERAKMYIQEHDLNLTEVAARIGVSDPGNFTRFFNRIGGMTPSQFRRLAQAQNAA